MNDSSMGMFAIWTAMSPTATATTAWPTIFAAFESPSERCRRTFV
jgi:hypothetical protein